MTHTATTPRSHAGQATPIAATSYVGRRRKQTPPDVGTERGIWPRPNNHIPPILDPLSKGKPGEDPDWWIWQ
jgi:hypothetical protein